MIYQTPDYTSFKDNKGSTTNHYHLLTYQIAKSETTLVLYLLLFIINVKLYCKCTIQKWSVVYFWGRRQTYTGYTNSCLIRTKKIILFTLYLIKNATLNKALFSLGFISMRLWNMTIYVEIPGCLWQGHLKSFQLLG